MQQQELPHVLATVKWYKPHSFTNYLRPSVVIMSSFFHHSAVQPLCLCQGLVHVVLILRLPLTSAMEMTR